MQPHNALAACPGLLGGRHQGRGGGRRFGGDGFGCRALHGKRKPLANLGPARPRVLPPATGLTGPPHHRCWARRACPRSPVLPVIATPPTAC